MIQSMTGFSNVSHKLEHLHITLEIRAVNHRYLDIQFKQPEELRPFESVLKEKIQNKIQRGKVECRIDIQQSELSNDQLTLNQNLLDTLLTLNKNILEKDNTLISLSVAEILKFPNIIQKNEFNIEKIKSTLLDLIDIALEDFCAFRIREGEKLKQHLLERLSSVSQTIEKTEQLMPEILQTHYDKLHMRLQEALVDIQEDRLKQEFVLFMQKADVDEELSRLKAHVAEVKHAINSKDGRVGKRLDFLMQELNREANTLGSKAIASESTQASVELKVLIEQMREQIQNIE